MTQERAFRDRVNERRMHREPERADERDFAPAANDEPRRQVRPLAAFRASSLAGTAIPERIWHVRDMIAAFIVAILYGDGATGKSLIALQLTVATVLGRLWFGYEVRKGRVLFLTAEDDRDEVHRRLIDIANEERVELADLDDLSIVSLAGEDALLAVPDARGTVLKPTAQFEALKALVEAERPVLIVLDTLADLFGGEENQRAQARQFITMLRGLASPIGATVLLLAHPSRNGMATGTGDSGSTAWSNSSRGRLYCKRVKNPDGTEDDPDVRALSVMKAQYGPPVAEIRLRWRAGVFVLDGATAGSIDAQALSAKADRVFLSLLADYNADGRRVTSANAGNSAPKLFSEDPRREGLSKDALRKAMNRLMAEKRVKLEFSGPASRQRSMLVIA